MMSDLPLARINTSLALQHPVNLIIYVQGLTSGFGGELLIERSPTDEFPPSFIVRENPGNPGINPDQAPTDVPTEAAFAFDEGGQLDEVTIIDSSGQRQINVVNVQYESEPASAYKCEWDAIHNFQPPGPAQLRVSGTCMMPTPGYKLTLTRAEPQGFNPRILLLNLKVEPPTGIVTQVLTPIPVSYEEVTDAHYDQVTILPDGETIDVEQVY